MPKYEEMALVFGDTLTPARSSTYESIVDLARGRHMALGGMPDVGAKSATYVDVPGAVVVRLAANVTARVQAMASVSAGTGYFRLYSVTEAAAVDGSEESFTDASPTLQEGADLELVAGDYKLQVKTSDAANHVIVYGAAIVTQ
jgi:hypothetical protein